MIVEMEVTMMMTMSIVIVGGDSFVMEKDVADDDHNLTIDAMKTPVTANRDNDIVHRRRKSIGRKDPGSNPGRLMASRQLRRRSCILNGIVVRDINPRWDSCGEGDHRISVSAVGLAPKKRPRPTK